MHSPEHHQEHTPLRQLEPRAVGPHDPVCGMAISNSQFSTQYEGRTYQFCSQKCKTTFRAEPERHRISSLEIEHGLQAPAEPFKSATEYTCPMHPEIRQIGPGVCPKVDIATDNNRHRSGHGWPCISAVSRPHAKLDRAGTGHTRGALGWLAILCTRRALGDSAKSEHVDADRPWHGGGLPLQRCGDPGP